MDVDEFLAFRGELDGIRWDETPKDSKRTAALMAGGQDGPEERASDLSDPAYCGWDDLNEGPADTDPSWEGFVPHDQAEEKSVGKMIQGGKKLTKAQREKLKNEEQMREARESIRKRGWTDNEVKWLSWLARRGHDVMVHDWNLSQYIDGECIPPSRDPFWLNSNEVDLPDYEAGNDGENEEPEPPITNLMGEVIGPKYPTTRKVVLKPLWWDVDGEQLVRDGMGRKAERYCWRQSTSQVYLEFKVPEGTSARDLRVTMRPTRVTIQIGQEAPLVDDELYMRIYVGSNGDDNSSIWELQDKRVVVFHLTKWHRLDAGNVRDASRTWWRQCLVNEEPFEQTVPTNAYYDAKEKR